MNKKVPRVLDVGQCDYDHGNISRTLAEEFEAVVDRAGTLEEAVNALSEADYDLVLVNRIFDANGMEGLGLIRKLRADDGGAQPPVMLVSNYADAQDAATVLGAQRGFGKDALGSAGTVELLAPFLRA